MIFATTSTPSFTNVISTITATEIFVLSLVILLVFSWYLNLASVNAPFAGYRSWFEPTFLHKSGKFWVRRIDGDTLILSNNYLEELRLFPNTVLSNAHAQYQNIKGKYTYASVVLHSILHTRVLLQQLTPKVGFYALRSKAAFDEAFYSLMPRSKEWVEVDIQSVARSIVARMTGAVFLGAATARNEEWLNISIQYPMDTFQTAFQLRMFPNFLHPLLARLLPSRYRLQGHRRRAGRIIQELITEHQRKVEAGEKTEDTLLEWMLDNAVGTEGSLEEMKSRQLVLTLASIHTTALALSHAFYDLCAHPEYVEPLREEIESVTKEFPSNEDFVNHGLQRLEKMDSFLVESQRLHPPVMMSPQRVARKTINLQDGTRIPSGTRIAFPSAAILNDSSVTPDPSVFDAFRSYRKRQVPGEKFNHVRVQTGKENLAFGHGKQACPGRHFAVAEIKVVLCRIIGEYDVKYWAGQVRPRTYYLDENVFPDPWAKLHFRHRGAGAEAASGKGGVAV
ncbi:cytochrome P450 monooxygenase [Polyplosphaeria fusca]|uniref:Cytochrome P450 monooxygenase n=1 Tax=Polyplosphaeria fusca TaxID=682080 RepID=A0A9P4UVW4_9PLEO|nr:cytochrome P450 monooxygenase [Polyplosphaeria fusca]